MLILAVFFLGCIYAAPNLFGDDPSVQVSATNATKLEQKQLDLIANTLQKAKIEVKLLESKKNRALIRFNNLHDQLKATDLLKTALGNGYNIALNLAPATPSWLRAINAHPMYLGLDLRGGVHFLLEVDMNAAIKLAKERYAGDIRNALRFKKIRYVAIAIEGNAVRVTLKDAQNTAAALEVINSDFSELQVVDSTHINEFLVTINATERKAIRKLALAQNMTTLRNRVNEIGVAEPIVQQQGDNRIVVQLPGIQDTAWAKEILGATATLEFRLVDTTHDTQKAIKGNSPIGSRLYYERNGQPILLKRRIIVTGDQIIDASSGFDQNGSASVFITLNGVGAKKMGRTTLDNIGKAMAVVFIETKVETKKINGEKVRHKQKIEEVINVATIQGNFSKRFQITGLDSPQEARNLGLLLRAGALAAPVEIIEERTIGPSLGQDSIDQGMASVIVGLVLVLVFMAFYYQVFGLVANIALAFNLVIIVAILSILQATLTLPGIAGIVLTVGMAVDANVLIFERIREELRNNNSPQASIHLGYEKAFVTIFDANVTTLLVALILFGFGAGPIKGFAITLSIGILTSMFTSILGTRMIINKIYGNKRIDKLAI